MAENRQYDHEYKVQAVKLAKEIGQVKAAIYGWIRANRLGSLDLEAGSQTPQSAMTLNEELIRLRQQVKRSGLRYKILEENVSTNLDKIKSGFHPV